MILINDINEGDFQKKQEEEDERVRKEIKEYEQVKTWRQNVSYISPGIKADEIFPGTQGFPGGAFLL